VQVKAILCDAASVREGLLHILGGGFTNVWRGEYPTGFWGALAMIISPEASEIGEQHKLVIKIMGDDEQLGNIERGFDVTPRPGTKHWPGELPPIPVVVSFVEQPLRLPKAGFYRFDVLVDNDQKDTVGFFANPPGARPQG